MCDDALVGKLYRELEAVRADRDRLERYYDKAVRLLQRRETQAAKKRKGK